MKQDIYIGMRLVYVNVRLDASVFNNKQRWNNDKCRSECKEFIWNRSICECECDKLCNIGQYLVYKSCKCRKELMDKLFEECSEDIYGNEMIHNVTLNDYVKV